MPETQSIGAVDRVYLSKALVARVGLKILLETGKPPTHEQIAELLGPFGVRPELVSKVIGDTKAFPLRVIQRIAANEGMGFAEFCAKLAQFGEEIAKLCQGLART